MNTHTSGVLVSIYDVTTTVPMLILMKEHVTQCNSVSVCVLLIVFGQAQWIYIRCWLHLLFCILCCFFYIGNKKNVEYHQHKQIIIFHRVFFCSFIWLVLYIAWNWCFPVWSLYSVYKWSLKHDWLFYVEFHVCVTEFLLYMFSPSVRFFLELGVLWYFLTMSVQINVFFCDLFANKKDNQLCCLKRIILSA